jgi:molybdenum cofactor cytidylyltransferase
VQLAEALQIAPGDVVALVGAGGKTTALFRLARELTDAGRRVITTTTTHLALEQNALAPTHVVWPEAGVLPITAALRAHRHVLVTGPADHALGKWTGLSETNITRLSDLADIVLVEADGARQLSFKAPAEHEPAIPSCATAVVTVVGLDILGQPLNASHVHRPERVAALTGAALGASVTADMIVRVLAHPLGGRKNVPPGARLVVLLNKIESPERASAAQRLAAQLLDAGGFTRVVISAAAAEQPVRAVFPSV